MVTWETQLTFHISKHTAYNRPLLMPLMCGLVFLLNILCLMASNALLQYDISNMIPFFPIRSELSKLFCKLIFLSLSQICVNASVKSFDPNFSCLNNLHFRAIRWLHDWFVRALAEELT